MGDQRGAVYVEFLMAFVPLFTLFLGIAQLVLLYGAQLVVDHAATRAVRAAVVVLDDDPRYYRDEPRNLIHGTALDPADVAVRVDRTAGVAGRRMISRRATIELAAVTTLLPLAARTSDATLANAIGWEGTDAAIAQTMSRTDVEFVRPPAPDAIGHEGSDPERITVKVRYRFPCVVPLARSLVCPGGDAVLEAQRTLPNHRASLDYAPGDWGVP
jgi:hypothetical protein